MILPFDVPVDPGPDDARDWLLNELSKPQYQAAKPTLFDRIAQSVWDWLTSLTIGGVQGPPAFGLLIIVIVVVVAVVLGILIFGLPRFGRRSRVVGALFGDEDDRTAADLRRASRAAAAREDWAEAIAEGFRAIARELAERDVLHTTPGTTATGFARRAAALDPTLTDAFTAAAGAFDDVRYLERPGTREQYETIVALDARARTLTSRAEVPA